MGVFFCKFRFANRAGNDARQLSRCAAYLYAVHESLRVWINSGYLRFAEGGLAAVRVEAMARDTGVSKSSFYHHFADLEVFFEALCIYHLERAAIIAEKETACTNIDPELIEVLTEHRTDLLFNRQLRVLRDDPVFGRCVRDADAAMGDGFIALWQRDLNRPVTPDQLRALFSLALENFFLQLTPEHLTREWLSAYFKNLRAVVKAAAGR